jgi:hypothetical protein
LGLQQPEHKEGVVLENAAEEIVVLLTAAVDAVAIFGQQFSHVFLHKKSMFVVACALEKVNINSHDFLEMDAVLALGE